MRTRATELVERLLPAGRAELETQFAIPYLGRVVNDLFGFPAADDRLIEQYCWATNTLLNSASQEHDQLDAADLYHHAHRTALLAERHDVRVEVGS